mgnify:CR=1 FL=1
MKKVLYVILGCVSVTLGAVGAVLPILPTVWKVRACVNRQKYVLCVL